jgi:bla regulator protein blaR1
MQTLFIEKMFSGPFVQAISWTLLHSLWQGLILALFAAGIILFTRRQQPGVRYNLLLLVFFSQLIASGITFYTQFQAANAIPFAELAKPVYTGVSASMPEGTIVPQLTLLEKVTIFLNDNAPVIVSIWMFVMIVMFVRMLAGITHLHKLRTVNTFQPAEHWKQQVQELADRLGVNRPVAFLESGLAKVPMVIGYIKPVILVPIGLLADLPTKQVEAILSHELAHIRREDYIVNILQSIAETLFFFNPAIWWISSLIRDEREHCCDHVAVKNTDKRTLVEALVAFQEYRRAGLAYAPAFATSKYKLLQRAKRIFDNRNNPLDPLVKVVLTGCIIMASFSLVAFKGAQSGGAFSGNDTIPASRKAEMDMKKQNSMDAGFTSAEKEKVKQMREELSKLETEIARESGPALNDLLTKKNRLNAAIDAMRSPGENKAAIELNQQLTEDNSRKLANDDAKGRLNEGAANDSKVTSDEQMQEERLRKAQIENEAEGRKIEEMKRVDKANEAKHNELFNNFINELLTEKIISSKDGLSFMLSNSKFVVNGRELPADVQKKFAGKYLQNKNSTMVYRYNNSMIGWLNNE